MNYKIEQKLDKWSFKVEQENLITWSNILNDPNPIHLDNKIVKKYIGPLSLSDLEEIINSYSNE